MSLISDEEWERDRERFEKNFKRAGVLGYISAIVALVFALAATGLVILSLIWFVTEVF